MLFCILFYVKNRCFSKNSLDDFLEPPPSLSARKETAAAQEAAPKVRAAGKV